MDDFDMDMTASDGPQSEWDRLSSEDRRELLRNVFDDEEWYDGPPFHQGGNYHPALGEIASKLGCKTDDIKMYYAAWLKAKGFTADQIKDALRAAPKTSMFSDEPQTVVPIPEAVKVEPSNAYKQQMDRMQAEAFDDPSTIMTPAFMQVQQKDSGDPVANSMGSMMQFMMAQQQIAARQQHQQQMMMMEQRRLDQQREESLRREQQARDQQFAMQQMAFMREMLRTKDNDGFFDSDMKAIFKTKMVENLLDGGGGSNSALEKVADRLLQPEILGAVASGAGAAMNRAQAPKPAGYDSPTYDPYATAPLPAPVQQVPQQVPPEMLNPSPVAAPMPPSGPDLFFGDEGEEEASEELVDAQPSAQEYKDAIMQPLRQQLGAALDDPKTLEAVQAQVAIAVDTTMVKHPNLPAEGKLEEMTKQVILIRNLRDIAQGINAASEELAKGTPPEAVYGYIVGQLKQNPVFWDIFSTNTYDELMGMIHPFVETGGVRFDYSFLQKPESAQVCREIIARIANA